MQRKLFEAVTKPMLALFKKANLVNVSLVERMSPIYQVTTPFGNLKFSCPNTTTLWRAKTIFTKEPDTIEWINSFAAQDIFFDIGANVGIYSIYAACQGIRSYSFEPESQNYATLNRNIYLNALHEKVDAFNIALSDKTCFGQLHIKQFTIGGALNNFGESINYKKEKFNPGFKQGVASFRLDDLISNFQLPIPNHIKIDVDGLESAIIAGSLQLLRYPELKTILIELNTALQADMEIIGVLENYGFKLMSRYRAPEYDHSEFKDIYNYIFKKS